MVKWIIDPTSMEENRGSFCYQPYYLYSVFRSQGDDVRFIEDFTITQKDLLNDVKPEDEVYIALWGYPQIDLCRLLHLRLPNALFFGYSPLIIEEHLPIYKMTVEEIKLGMEAYAGYSKEFRYLLLSDCDGHLKDKPEVYPLCTSYGCVNNCSFCPVTPNLPAKMRINSDLESVFRAIRVYQQQIPGSGIHYTDEDFFLDLERAKTILYKGSLITKEMGQEPAIIALASVRSLTRFLDSFETDDIAFAFCDDVGLFLAEVGLESADVDIASHMGKIAVEKAIELAERIKGRNLEILWLSLTLSPGETISSIRTTGIFLKRYGLDPYEMSPRIRTNGTYGGLGQFFQIYHGTRDCSKAFIQGKSLSQRQSRLIPSYIPNSLLECTLKKHREYTQEDKYWFELYGVPMIKFFDEKEETVYNFFLRNRTYPLYSVVISLCLAARLNVVEQV